MDYTKWDGVGEAEEQEEVVAFFEQVQNQHLNYVNHIEAHSPYNPANKKAASQERLADEKLYLDFRDELASVTARGEFLAREARASIDAMMPGVTVDGSQRDRIAADIDAQIDAECPLPSF